jgi:hypothetical protein
VIEKDIVPDYVINYLRGETPETLARKKELRSLGPQSGADLAKHVRDHFARTPGFFDSATSESNESDSRSASAHDNDLERMLPDGEKRQDAGWRKALTGWRGGVAVNALIAFFALIVAIVCLILAVSKSRVWGGESIIYEGSCEQTRRINYGLRAVINVVVVVLLAGANYVYQVLGSPTRIECAVAHDLKRWLDIGIPSCRNLSMISSARVLLMAIALFAAISTQVM